MKWFHRLKLELRIALTRPRTNLTRGQRFVRYCMDLALHARNELREDAATTMAAALTYRTIFGLVPVLVMTLIVFRAFGGFDDNAQNGLRDMVYSVLEIERPDPTPTDDPAEDAKLQLNVDDFPEMFRPLVEEAIAKSIQESPLAAAGRAEIELQQRIDNILGDLSSRAANIDMSKIGVVGMLILIWAALGLIVTIEKNFNVIFKAPQGRPWHVRIPIYWAVITLGPVLVWASFYFSNRLIEYSAELQYVGGLFAWLNRFAALLVTWLLFVLMFKLLPNARVKMRPAMIGAMVSALAWEGMKAALRWYIDNAVVGSTQSALYGSLALIPIMLLWTYITWLIILAGLEVTHILQTLPAQRLGLARATLLPDNAAQTPLRDPWLVIPVLSAIAEAFHQGQTVSVNEIAERLDATMKEVGRVTRELTRRGLLHHLPDEDGPDRLSLAMPPDKIRIADLIDTTHDAAGDDMPGHALLQQLADAQNQALADATLEGASARRRGGDG
ncbi:YihY family inner membrane protein [Phycisphaeraceae bacterium D3-23]